MYFGALVGEYYFCVIQCTDMEHIINLLKPSCNFTYHQV
jgi:hypothetical protein